MLLKYFSYFYLFYGDNGTFNINNKLGQMSYYLCNLYLFDYDKAFDVVLKWLYCFNKKITYKSKISLKLAGRVFADISFDIKII